MRIALLRSAGSLRRHAIRGFTDCLLALAVLKCKRMSITVTDHIKNFSREVGFNWKKALRLALFGRGAGAGSRAGHPAPGFLIPFRFWANVARQIPNVSAFVLRLTPWENHSRAISAIEVPPVQFRRLALPGRGRCRTTITHAHDQMARGLPASTGASSFSAP